MLLVHIRCNLEQAYRSCFVFVCKHRRRTGLRALTAAGQSIDLSSRRWHVCMSVVCVASDIWEYGAQTPRRWTVLPCPTLATRARCRRLLQVSSEAVHARCPAIPMQRIAASSVAGGVLPPMCDVLSGRGACQGGLGVCCVSAARDGRRGQVQMLAKPFPIGRDAVDLAGQRGEDVDAPLAPTRYRQRPNGASGSSCS